MSFFSSLFGGGDADEAARDQRRAQARSEFENRLQAVQARREEAQRQARINSGMRAADMIFGQYGLDGVSGNISPINFDPSLSQADRQAFQSYANNGFGQFDSFDTPVQYGTPEPQAQPQQQAAPSSRGNSARADSISGGQGGGLADTITSGQSGRAPSGSFAQPAQSRQAGSRNPLADRLNDRFGSGYAPSGFDEDLLDPIDRIDPRLFLPEGFQSQADPDFLAQRQKAYLDYASPQVDDQLKEQQRQLIYALAGGGNMQSSIASHRNQQLQEQYAKAQQQIQGRAKDYRNQAEDQLASARDMLVSSLQAGENPNVATRQAIQSIQQTQRAPTFDPLGELFAGATRGLAGYQQGKGVRAQDQEMLEDDFSGAYARNLKGKGSSRVVR